MGCGWRREGEMLSIGKKYGTNLGKGLLDYLYLGGTDN